MKQLIFCAVVSSLVFSVSRAQADREVSEHVLLANKAIAEQLDFADQRDFENARRGFIATHQDPKISGADGNIAFDLSAQDFLKGPAPATANPSLWRQGQLTAMHGLFKVTDGIYQVRGYDLSNITFIEGDKGWIVVDPLLTRETAASAKALVDQELGKRPVSAVVVTHSHADHYGGLRGIIDEQDLANGVELIAPEGFVVESVSENVLAGIAMSRRATYMYGTFLGNGETGLVGIGLGPALSDGVTGLLQPTIDVTETGQSVTVDGIEIQFILTLGAEAPAEFMFYLPKFKAFCQAEIINHNLHNMLTPRGAKVRDGRIWSKYIDEAIYTYGDVAEVSFGSHHWPTWGRDEILDLWAGQRDLYRYIHDQTLRLSNSGATIQEIPSLLQLPDGISNKFANRGYYGDLGFNARSQYQMYYGFFDGNPANLNPLPPEPAAAKYVEYMGGARKIMRRAKKDFANGEYKSVIMVLNHLVFAEPENTAAKRLLADAYTQMAYMAESGPHRNFYLSAALELTSGIPQVPSINVGTLDTIKAMPLDMIFDLLAVRLNGPAAADKDWSFNFNLTDSGQKSLLFLSNGTLHHRMGHNSDAATATLNISRSALDLLNLKQTTFPELLQSGQASIDGDGEKLGAFFALMEEPNFWFNIVTP